jgi:hypothetical protein
MAGPCVGPFETPGRRVPWRRQSMKAYSGLGALVLLVVIATLTTPVAGIDFIDRLTNGSVLPSTLLYLQIGAALIACWLVILFQFVVSKLWLPDLNNAFRSTFHSPWALWADTHDLDKMEDSVELQIEVHESAHKVAIRRYVVALVVSPFLLIIIIIVVDVVVCSVSLSPLLCSSRAGTSLQHFSSHQCHCLLFLRTCACAFLSSRVSLVHVQVCFSDIFGAIRFSSG